MLLCRVSAKNTPLAQEQQEERLLEGPSLAGPSGNPNRILASNQYVRTRREMLMQNLVAYLEDAIHGNHRVRRDACVLARADAQHRRENVAEVRVPPTGEDLPQRLALHQLRPQLADGGERAILAMEIRGARLVRTVLLGLVEALHHHRQEGGYARVPLQDNHLRMQQSQAMHPALLKVDIMNV